MQRERFGSRLGFILLSAGCAVGIGNVWRFPYVVGNNGGGLFVLFYLLFLIAVGVPILTMEYAIGRASRKSAVCAYQVLEKPGSKWHAHGPVAMVGNYVLMMFYTTVSGWMICYFARFLTGEMQGLDPQGVGEAFTAMLGNPGLMAFWMLVIVAAGFAICSVGLQKGVERVTKWMMLALLALIAVLAVHSLTLPGGMEGLRFYLYPDTAKVREAGLVSVISAAMNQSFFTLSLGIGAMLIFGSYLDNRRTLLGEALTVAGLDTIVALASGLIIFPACFSFGVSPDYGPGLVFVTLPNVFASMVGGRVWGTLFFLFMTFASLSTVMAVFENILSCCMDKWGISRGRAALFNGVLIAVLSMPCVLGYNLWSGFQPLGEGSAVLDLEDFIVSNILLPGGSLVYLLFCVSRTGWGFDNYLKEANQGKGMKMPRAVRVYVTYVLPILVLVLLIQSVWSVLGKLI